MTATDICNITEKDNLATNIQVIKEINFGDSNMQRKSSQDTQDFLTELADVTEDAGVLHFSGVVAGT